MLHLFPLSGLTVSSENYDADGLISQKTGVSFRESIIHNVMNYQYHTIVGNTGTTQQET
jgi:hypothetical protein